jgi:hypothetical protein
MLYPSSAYLRCNRPARDTMTMRAGLDRSMLGACPKSACSMLRAPLERPYKRRVQTRASPLPSSIPDAPQTHSGRLGCVQKGTKLGVGNDLAFADRLAPLGPGASNVVCHDSVRQLDLKQLTHLSGEVAAPTGVEKTVCSSLLQNFWIMNHCVNLI